MGNAQKVAHTVPPPWFYGLQTSEVQTDKCGYTAECKEKVSLECQAKGGNTARAGRMRLLKLSIADSGTDSLRDQHPKPKRAVAAALVHFEDLNQW